MKKALFVGAGVILVVSLGFAWNLWAPAQAPAGQPPLAHLDASSYARLKAAFNGASDTSRVVALLSPT